MLYLVIWSEFLIKRIWEEKSTKADTAVWSLGGFAQPASLLGNTAVMQTPIKRRKHLLLSFFSLLTTTHGCFLGYTVPHPDIHFPSPLTPGAQAPAIPTHGSARSSNFWTFLKSEALGADFLIDSLDLHLLAMLAGSTSPQWPLHEIPKFFFLVLFLMQAKNLTMGNSQM